MKYAWLCSFAIVVVGCATDDSPSVEFLSMPGANPDLPFSDAVRVDNMLFMSGAIGNKPGTLELVEGGIEAQTRQIMETIKARAEAFGSSMDDLVKCSVFMADMSEWGAMNEVYRSYFQTPPARSALGANGLALGAAVEIECIAVIR